MIDCDHGRAIQLQLRFFKKEGEIATAFYTEYRLQPRKDISFEPIGLDEPYRVLISEDPIGFAAKDYNHFRYVENNSLNGKDPLGLWYTDINVTVGFPIFLGFTGGMLIADSGIYPYIGGGIVTPGLGGSVLFFGLNRPKIYH